MSNEKKGLNVSKLPTTVWRVSFLTGAPTSRGSTDPHCTKKIVRKEKKKVLCQQKVTSACLWKDKSTHIFQTFTHPLIQDHQLMSKVWPWGSNTTNNSNLIRLCILMHAWARKKVGETADWTQTGEESRRTKRLTVTPKPEPDTSPPPAQNTVSSMIEMSR